MLIVPLNLHHPGKNTSLTFATTVINNKILSNNSNQNNTNENDDTNILLTTIEELPGGLNMEENTTQKYFGINARKKFFDRYQWLTKQREKLLIKNDDELKCLIFENEHGMIY